MNDFTKLVEEIEPEGHAWEINILNKWPNVDSGNCYVVGVEIMREILRINDMAQILRLVRSGDLKSGSVDHDRSDYTLYRDREDWSEDDTADFHSYIKNELASFGGR